MKSQILLKVIVCICFSTLAYVAAAQPQAAFTATPLTGCAPLVVNFQNQSINAVQWRWDLGNGSISFLQNPSATYFTPGTFTVRLIVKNAAGLADTLVRTNYITVNPIPQIAFSGNTLNGCIPLSVQFSNSTVTLGSTTTWNWDFGDGGSSSLQNPSYTYTSPGSFNVSLLAVNSFGCIASLTKPNYIVTNPKVTAGFTFIPPTGCVVPQTISFTNTTTGTGPLTYLWNFGDGSTSVAANPSHIYTAGGSYSVTLIATNSFGCSDTIQRMNIVSIGNNSTSFSSPAISCAGKEIAFTNTSTPGPTTSFWQFGDGTTSTLLSPVKTYTTPGVYTVKLRNQFGSCADSISRIITISPGAIAGFQGSPLEACAPNLTVNFTNTATGVQSVLWLFGDGATSTQLSPSHTYTSSGSFTVTQIVTNNSGCNDTLIRPVYVKIQRPEITLDNLPTEGCAPFPWTFTATNNSNIPITSYLWDFGDGTTSTAASPSHIFSVGNYDITLIVQVAGGCADTIKVPGGIIASLKPVAAFTATPREACAKIPINFSSSGSTGSIDTWFWDFGDGGTSTASSPIHMYSDTGYFNIMLVVGSNSCYDTLTINQYIYIKPPIASFSVSADCINKYNKVFVDQSVGADEWYWDFGDGATSTLQNPAHIYTVPGIYIVSLRVFNISTGCDHTKTQEIIVADEPAQFTASSTEFCKGSGTTFTATAAQSQSQILFYDWSFGDGATDTGRVVNHIYTTAGIFDVTLIITDVNGCTDTLRRIAYITVIGPVANFTHIAPPSCGNFPITFLDATITNGSYPVTNWNWDYGDNTIVNGAVAPFTHLYTTPGIFSVTMTITDSFGCMDTITKPNLITISFPEANFSTPDTASCPSAGVQFINTSTGPSLSYFWDFGDGTTSTLAQPIHSYATDGVYTVSLNITDQFGCTASLVRDNYIRIVTPLADFTVNNTTSTCPPLIVQFNNTSVNFASILWDFGDGNTSSSANPSHFYNFPGVFTARLTVTSPGGCTSFKEMPITVSGPQGNFSYSPLEGCLPLRVSFTATSLARSSFIWDFSDGTTVATTDSVVIHEYTIPGTYIPRMILQDMNGCTVSIAGIDTIRVNGVEARFSTDTLLGCNRTLIQFTNESVGNQAIAGFEWDFGDGQTSTAENPLHEYLLPGIYFPKLKVTTSGGCTDTVTSALPVKIVLSPEVSVASPLNGCAPLNLSVTGNLINGDTSQIRWDWRFSDGTTHTGISSPPLVFANAGTYTYSLIATNSSGCKDTVAGSFEVYPLPNVVAGNDLTICQNAGRNLSAAGAVSYSWSPSAGLSCITCANPIATPDSARTYAVTGTNSYGCINRDSVSVEVIYPLRMSTNGEDTLCIGSSTSLSATGAASYAWTPPTGLNNTTASTVMAKPIVTTLYRVIGKDGKNCFSDTAYFPVQVYPMPTVILRGDTTISVGNTIILTPQVSQDVNQVLWQNPIGLVQTNYPSITVRPTGQTQYNVTVSNVGGCTARSSVNISVICNDANVFIPNTFSPNADGANDVFYVRGTGLFNVKLMRVFNRWGELVFSSNAVRANDASTGWDGTYKGKKLGTDVYVYMIEVQCESNTSLLYKGNVTLLK